MADGMLPRLPPCRCPGSAAGEVQDGCAGGSGQPSGQRTVTYAHDRGARCATAASPTKNFATSSASTLTGWRTARPSPRCRPALPGCLSVRQRLPGTATFEARSGSCSASTAVRPPDPLTRPLRRRRRRRIVSATFLVAVGMRLRELARGHRGGARHDDRPVRLLGRNQAGHRTHRRRRVGDPGCYSCHHRTHQFGRVGRRLEAVATGERRRGTAVAQPWCMGQAGLGSPLEFAGSTGRGS